MAISYYERLRLAARELFGEDADFEFCRTSQRKQYHVIKSGETTLANVRLKDIPVGKRIIFTFEAAAEAVGNIDLSTIRTVLKKHGI